MRASRSRKPRRNKRLKVLNALGGNAIFRHGEKSAKEALAGRAGTTITVSLPDSHR